MGLTGEARKDVLKVSAGHAAPPRGQGPEPLAPTVQLRPTVHSANAASGARWLSPGPPAPFLPVAATKEPTGTEPPQALSPRGLLSNAGRRT